MRLIIFASEYDRCSGTQGPPMCDADSGGRSASPYRPRMTLMAPLALSHRSSTLLLALALRLRRQLHDPDLGLDARRLHPGRQHDLDRGGRRRNTPGPGDAREGQSMVWQVLDRLRRLHDHLAPERRRGQEDHRRAARQTVLRGLQSARGRVPQAAPRDEEEGGRRQPPFRITAMDGAPPSSCSWRSPTCRFGRAMWPSSRSIPIGPSSSSLFR